MQANNVRLNSHQKAVLVIIKSSATPKVAAEDIHSCQNLYAAAKLLQQVGAIQFTETAVSLTPEGEDLAKQSNLLDDLGNVTTQGKVYLKLSKHDSASPEESTDQPTVGESLMASLLSSS